MKPKNTRWSETSIDEIPHDRGYGHKNRGRVSGIYAIEIPHLKIAYIGQSTSIGNRWRQHRHILNKGKSENLRLQEAWNKHKEHFEFVILKECTNDILLELEKDTIRDYISRGWNLLNSPIVTGIFVPEQYQQTIKRLLSLLSKGAITIEQLDLAIENIENQ